MNSTYSLFVFVFLTALAFGGITLIAYRRQWISLIDSSLSAEETIISVSEIPLMVSVEQAHDVATDLSIKGEVEKARKVLEQILTYNLPGDPADFHNAHAQAMRINDPKLAFQIVEAGLKNFPDQYDLVADKVKTMQAIGRAAEAKSFFEEWWRRNPDGIVRSWRPVVFYEDLFDSLPMSQEDAKNIEKAFKEVVSRLPMEVKPWAEYADFLKKRGRLKESEGIFKKALSINPLSQQLNYMLGEFLLSQGKVEDAIHYLEKALGNDYQAQFSPDVNRYAVQGTLAMAYEANKTYDKAELLYRNIVRAPEASRTFRDYAKARLEAIALLNGNLPEEPEADTTNLHALIEALRSSESQIPASAPLTAEQEIDQKEMPPRNFEQLLTKALNEWALTSLLPQLLDFITQREGQAIRRQETLEKLFSPQEKFRE